MYEYVESAILTSLRWLKMFAPFFVATNLSSSAGATRLSIVREPPPAMLIDIAVQDV